MRKFKKIVSMICILVIISMLILCVYGHKTSSAYTEEHNNFDIRSVSNASQNEEYVKSALDDNGREDKEILEIKQVQIQGRVTLILLIDEKALLEISGIGIEVIGANRIEPRNYPDITSKEIEITKEGKSIVKAWTIDKQGNISNKITEITIELDNTKPDVSDLSLEVTKGNSPLQNGWYNSNEVEVTITSNMDEDKKQKYKTVYGTRVKGNTHEIENLKILNGKSEVIKVEEEGITEVIAYRESLSGVKSDIKTIDVKIDRTPPKIGELMCIKTKDNKVEMNLTDAQDEYGMNKYIFYTNNTKNEQVITDSQNPETTISEVKPSSLVTVIAVDNAGNYMANSSPYAETEYPAIYDYCVYEASAYGTPVQEIIIDEEINAYLTIRNFSSLANLYQEVRIVNNNYINFNCANGNLCDIAIGDKFAMSINSIFNEMDSSADPQVTACGYRCDDVFLANFCGWQGEQISCRKRIL